MNGVPILYKAVRPDGRSFWDGRTVWAVGEVTNHPLPMNVERRKTRSADAYLSVSDSPTECTGMQWPCRLLIVEPAGRSKPWQVGDLLPHKWAGAAWRVVEERPAHEVFGPQGEQVVALLARIPAMTAQEIRDTDAARGAARGAAWDAARCAAWDAAWDAARDAAWDAAWGVAWDATRCAARCAAWDAVLGLFVRDLITPEHYATLTGPLASVIGPIHPDDATR